MLRCDLVKVRRPSPSELELRHLRAFIALADHGSVTAAARALGVAQSTMSEALAALERALSTQLIQRRGGTQGAALTTSGQALLPPAREVLAAVDGLHVAIAASVRTARGVVEIIANESISTYVLPRILTHARQRWPNTRFPVSVAMCPDVRRAVAEGGSDIGLLLERHTGSRVRAAKPVARLSNRQIVAPLIELVAFTSPLHPLTRAARPSVARDVLAGFPVFVSDSAGDFTVMIERFFGSEGLPRPRLQATGSIEGVKEAVMMDSRAVGILPAYTVTNELASARVRRLALRPALPNMRIVALCSTGRERHPAIPELLDGIRRTFAEVRSGYAVRSAASGR